MSLRLKVKGSFSWVVFVLLLQELICADSDSGFQQNVDGDYKVLSVGVRKKPR